MTRWEYRVEIDTIAPLAEQDHERLSQLLNDAGDEDWELVEIREFLDYYTPERRFVFKRPKEATR